jgi:hypothetical protein
MDSGPGDEMLLLAVAERDMGAFRTLYERHAGWLAIRLARRCNDRDLVADAIGDIFVAVWQKPAAEICPRGCAVFRDPGDDGLEASRIPPCGQPHPPRRPTPFCLGRLVRSVDGSDLD